MSAGGSKRPRYETGSYLTAWDLFDDQVDRRQRLRRHRRLLHGSGAICGLWVVPANDPARPWAVRVCPGYALGSHGGEIVVPAPAVVDVRDYLWRLPRGQRPLVAYVGIRYVETPVRPLPAELRVCGCGDPVQEPSRWRDGFQVDILWQFPLTGGTFVIDPCEPEPVPCPECPESPHVVLARLDLPASEGNPITAPHIDNRVRRKQQGTLTGRVFEDRDANGIQGSDEPGLAGVDVVITDSQGEIRTVTTNATGDYRATLPPGSATVNVIDGTLPPGTVRTAGTDPATVSVPAGGTVITSVGYQRRGTLQGLVFEDLNGDGVRNSGEPGIAGVDVVITDSQGGDRTATTDTDGNYSATLPAGSASVDVSNGTLPSGSVRTAGSDPASVDVPAGDTVSTTVGYQRRGTLRGLVFEDLNGNGVRDSGEPGLANVDLVITDDQGGTRTVTTDADGNYSATLPAGSASVDVVNGTLPSGSQLTTGSDPATVDVPAGGNSTTVVHGYRQLGTLEGLVFNDQNEDGVRNTGEPGLSNTPVNITDRSGSFPPVFTDANGRYVRTVVAGSVTVDVDKPPSDPGFTWLATGTNPTTVNVPGGGTATTEVGFHLEDLRKVAPEPFPLTAVKGVGPTFAERLEEAGIGDARALANATDEQVAAALGTGTKRAARLISAAKDAVS